MSFTVAPRRQSFGGKIGESLGTGLAALAQSKLDSITQREMQMKGQKALGSLEGVSPEMAKNLAPLLNNPAFIKEALKGIRENEYMKSSGGNANGEGEFPGLRAPRNSQEEMKQLEYKQKEREIKNAREDKEYGRIVKRNEPFFTREAERTSYAHEVEPVVQRIKKLLSDDSTPSGARGLTPRFFQTTNGQKLLQEIAHLQGIKAKSYGGQTTNGKLALAALEKLSAFDTREAQQSHVDEILKEIESINNEQDIIDDVIRENGGREPDNIGNVVRKRLQQQQKDLKSKTFDDVSAIEKNAKNNNVPIGKSATLEDGTKLYWNGEKMVKENPLKDEGLQLGKVRL
jgi:hypothetical protein